MTQDQLQQYFAYQSGTPAQMQACVDVRTAMYRAAELFRSLTPEGEGQRLALIQTKAALQAMIGQIVAPLPE